MEEKSQKRLIVDGTVEEPFGESPDLLASATELGTSGYTHVVDGRGKGFPLSASAFLSAQAPAMGFPERQDNALQALSCRGQRTEESSATGKSWRSNALTPPQQDHPGTIGKIMRAHMLVPHDIVADYHHCQSVPLQQTDRESNQ